MAILTGWLHLLRARSGERRTHRSCCHSDLTSAPSCIPGSWLSPISLLFSILNKCQFHQILNPAMPRALSNPWGAWKFCSPPWLLPWCGVARPHGAGTGIPSSQLKLLASFVSTELKGCPLVCMLSLLFSPSASRVAEGPRAGKEPSGEPSLSSTVGMICGKSPCLSGPQCSHLYSGVSVPAHPPLP